MKDKSLNFKFDL